MLVKKTKSSDRARETFLLNELQRSCVVHHTSVCVPKTRIATATSYDVKGWLYQSETNLGRFEHHNIRLFDRATYSSDFANSEAERR